MKRTVLEEYLGQTVRIALFDGEICDGILHKSGEEKYKNNPNLYLPKNYYFVTDKSGECISCMFRTSHVRTLYPS